MATPAEQIWNFFSLSCRIETAQAALDEAPPGFKGHIYSDSNGLLRLRLSKRPEKRIDGQPATLLAIVGKSIKN